MKRNACVDRGLSPLALLSAFDHSEALCFGAEADDNTSPAPAWNPSCPGQLCQPTPPSPFLPTVPSMLGAPSLQEEVSHSRPRAAGQP
ncbi:hypothetical protein MHYP_G00134160 [Metynnis hypsauchen]